MDKRGYCALLFKGPTRMQLGAEVAYRLPILLGGVSYLPARIWPFVAACDIVPARNFEFQHSSMIMARREWHGETRELLEVHSVPTEHNAGAFQTVLGRTGQSVSRTT